MRKIAVCFSFLILVLASSCKKNSSNPEAVKQDSLGVNWTKVVPSPGFLNDVFFLGTKGYGVGENKVFRSSNGFSWENVLQTEGLVFNIAMGNANNAIMVSYNKIYITRNGGNSFDSISLGSYRHNDAFFVNETTAYVIANDFWRTTDAGKTWENLHTFKSSNYVSETLFFLDENYGFASAGDGLFKTTDGGVNWERLPGLIEAPTSIYMVDQNTTYVTTRNKVRKTDDGGKTWKSVLSQPDWLIDIHFINEKVGYTNTAKSIYKTTDGGLTWLKVIQLGNDAPDKQIIELHFLSENNGYAGGTDIFRYQ